ncbi:succinate dehydrogenase assembly factor 3, mitochondrial-like isoform X2 [Apostichopus japonicus]|uniref:succinate dehydrogenase assembly factor 3, mitochondrial-like isoform X2 n=1 Tax=Stichopus japonicus TaxID=307972 RepID=UPI003AB74CE7
MDSVCVYNHNLTGFPKTEKKVSTRTSRTSNRQRFNQDVKAIFTSTMDFPYCTVMASSVQARSVRVLYRRILTLHRKLPLEMKALGDEYARAEFKLHKKVGQAEAANFVKEWTQYADMIDMQTKMSDVSIEEIGSNLDETKLNDFREEQLGQLLELHKETSRPLDDLTDEKR